RVTHLVEVELESTVVAHTLVARRRADGHVCERLGSELAVAVLERSAVPRAADVSGGGVAALLLQAAAVVGVVGLRLHPHAERDGLDLERARRALEGLEGRP